MYARTRRPFSPEEKAILEGLAAGGRPSVLSTVPVSIVLTCLLFTLAAVIAGAFPTLGNLVSALAVASSVIGGVLVHRWRTRVALQRRNVYLREADSGEAEVLTCTATRVAEAEVLEWDCGPAYFFEIDPARTLFLAGQYLRTASSPFPATEFELVYAPLTLTPLSLRASGNALPLSAHVDLDEANRAPPEDRSVLEAPFDDIVARYPRLP